MKVLVKIFALSLLIALPLSSFSQKKIDIKKRYNLTSDYEIQVLKLNKQKGTDLAVSGGGGTIYTKAEKGKKYIELWLKIKNLSEKKFVFDFTKFKLVDENGNQYEPYLCVGNGLNKKYCDKINFKLKPNKRRLARINFSPTIPKKTKITYLVYDGEKIVSF